MITKIFIILFFVLSLNNSFSKIKEINYINLDIEKERNNDFLNNYKNHSLNIKINRFNGIIVKNNGIPIFRYTNTGLLTRGEKGASLSHMELLKRVSKKKNGWYLICEDDCKGNFQKIEEKTRLIRFFFPFVGVINLCCIKTNNNGFGHNTGMVCYMVKPWCAKIMYQIIYKNIDTKPCDISLHFSKFLTIFSFHIHNLMGISNNESSIDKINKLNKL